MQHDERATHLAYKTCLDNFIVPLVSRHFGKIVKSTGDGFFALFDSVVAAMECALALQANLSSFQTRHSVVPALQYRLGVSSGDVISENEDIYGNDVNLAARLQEQAEPGAICITAGTYEQVGAKLSAQFADLGDITFKNGETPTRVYACYPEGAALRTSKRGAARSWFHSRGLGQKKPAAVAAAGALALAMAFGFFLAGPDRGSPSSGDSLSASSTVTSGTDTGRPSIAVLAFDDMSQSPETRALSLGIGDTIATALAASKRFFVIDPKSSLAFSSASPSVKEIARQLDVRFLLLGSVNQKGEKIRVNARLVDMETGRNHWAYSVLEDVDKVFDIEDRITNEIIAALSEGPRAPAGKGVPGSTKNIAAYRSFLKGWMLLQARPVPEADAAISYLEEAILNDPDYGNAHAALAAAYLAKSRYIFPKWSKIIKVTEGTLSDMWIARQEILDKAETYLAFALKVPTAYAYRISSQINYIKSNYEAAARDSTKAFLRDPNDADSAAEYGMALIWNGETEDGVKEIERAIRINPKGKDGYSAYLGIANFVQRRYHKALAELVSSLSVEAHEEIAIIHIIAAYGQLDETEKAQEYIRRLNEIRFVRGVRPEYIQRILRNLPYKHQTNRLHLAAGLHKAGMKFGIERVTAD